MLSQSFFPTSCAICKLCLLKMKIADFGASSLNYSSSHSSISSPPPGPPGILPSFSSFSSLVISCKLFAFRMSASTFFFSFSVSLTRYDLSPALALPLAREEDGMSKVRDLMPIICREERVSRDTLRISGIDAMQRAKVKHTLAASADGSLAVPNSSVARARSTSLTF